MAIFYKMMSLLKKLKKLFLSEKSGGSKAIPPIAPPLFAYVSIEESKSEKNALNTTVVLHNEVKKS